MSRPDPTAREIPITLYDAGTEEDELADVVALDAVADIEAVADARVNDMAIGGLLRERS